MQAPHEDSVSNCRGPQTIFQERNLFFLSAAEEICGSPLPELETFSKLLCRPCDRRLSNYKNVTRAESKTVCTHLRTSSAILKYEFSPYPRYYSIVLSTKFSGGPTPAAQFIDTHFHVTSRNQGSFTSEER